MSELRQNFSGIHLAFDASEKECGAGAVLIELTDSGEVLELAFYAHKKRHYIRFLAADLRRAMKTRGARSRRNE
jgi:hypothetical protein